MSPKYHVCKCEHRQCSLLGQGYLNGTCFLLKMPTHLGAFPAGTAQAPVPTPPPRPLPCTGTPRPASRVPPSALAPPSGGPWRGQPFPSRPPTQSPRIVPTLTHRDGGSTSSFYHPEHPAVSLAGPSPSLPAPTTRFSLSPIPVNSEMGLSDPLLQNAS